MTRLVLLGFASVGLLVGWYQYKRWSRLAGPTRSAQLLRWTGIALGLFLILLLLARSGSILTLPLLGALIPVIWRWRALWGNALLGTGKSSKAGDSETGKSSSSQVETRFLRMVLNHAGGKLEGTVLKGRFEGEQLSQLSLTDLLLLYQECQSDPHSVSVLEAYLDRTHKNTWRAEYARSQRNDSFANVAMGREEAYEILGLQPGASLDEVKAAHRRLMQKVHPDHGGSTYLAARINKAKDMLLGK